jgi:hypothetical protein
MDWFVEFNKLLEVFGFFDFVVRLGWFVVCVGVVLFFVRNLHYHAHHCIKKWGSILSQTTLCF